MENPECHPLQEKEGEAPNSSNSSDSDHASMTGGELSKLQHEKQLLKISFFLEVFFDSSFTDISSIFRKASICFR
jgi:hypothetical protein